MARNLSLSPFQNSKRHPQIQSKTPGIARRSLEVVPTPATTSVSNYFRSMRRRQNPRVPLRSPRRELRPGVFNLSIRPTVHPQSMNLCSVLVRVVFSDEPPLLLYLGFLCFLVCAGPPSPSPHLPRVTPLPLNFPPPLGPAPLAATGSASPCSAPPLPSPSHG
jgi:hypothetical protein